MEGGIMFMAYLEQSKVWLHGTILGQIPFLERGVFQLFDLFAGPIVGAGRFHWVQILESLVLAGGVYLTGRHVRPSGGWRGFIRYCFPKELYTHPSAIVDYQLAAVNAAFGFVFNIAW